MEGTRFVEEWLLETASNGKPQWVTTLDWVCLGAVVTVFIVAYFQVQDHISHQTHPAMQTSYIQVIWLPSVCAFVAWVTLLHPHSSQLLSARNSESALNPWSVTLVQLLMERNVSAVRTLTARTPSSVIAEHSVTLSAMSVFKRLTARNPSSVTLQHLREQGVAEQR